VNSPVIRDDGYELSNSSWIGDRVDYISLCFVQPCPVAHTSPYAIFTGIYFAEESALAEAKNEWSPKYTAS
jgi:hypothetical protein